MSQSKKLSEERNSLMKSASTAYDVMQKYFDKSEKGKYLRI